MMALSRAFRRSATLSTNNTDHAEGLVDVKTVEIGENGRCDIGNWHTQNPSLMSIAWSSPVMATPIPKILSLPVNITEDPWISEKFPAGEGTKMIDVPFIQGGIDALSGFNSFYFAILTLKREAAK